MKRLARALLGRLVADYRINWILACSVPPQEPGEEAVRIDAAIMEQLAASPTPKMRGSLSYARAGLQGLSLVRSGAPVCVAHFATPGQYGRDGTWPLRDGEIALMDIATEEAMRGQGHAVRLIEAAGRHYLGRGRSRLIAFVWWSNSPSLRAFAKAGWRRIGLSLEWQRKGRWHALHLPLSRRFASTACEAGAVR